MYIKSTAPDYTNTLTLSSTKLSQVQGTHCNDMTWIDSPDIFERIPMQLHPFNGLIIAL